MGTSLGNYVAGGNAEGLGLPSAPKERTAAEIAEWRARNEEKSRQRSSGIVRRTDQTPPAPAPEPVVSTPEPVTPQPTPKPRPSTRPAVDDQKARDLAIITAYTAGDSIPEIATARGHATSTVRRVLLGAGIELRDDRKTNSGGTPAEDSDPELVESLRALAASGEQTAQEIADSLGMSKSTLANVAQRNGISFARQPARDAARVSAGFSTYREEMEAAGATSAILRAYAIATGMKVGKVGIPGRKIFTAWLEAGSPSIDEMPDPVPAAPSSEAPEPTSTSTPPTPDSAPPPPPLDVVDVAAVTAMAEQLTQTDDVLTLVDAHLFPRRVAQAITDILDLIELARLATAHDLKADLEAAAGRILRATVCPTTGGQQ